MSAVQESPAGDKTVLLAEPRGFCAGVRRAIAMVERALAMHGPPVYVRKQIVHNHVVVRALESKGARFVDRVEEIPKDAVCIFSAHGVEPQVRADARRRTLDVIDATCPLVAKVHNEARRFARDSRVVLLVGHADHEEVEGTRGEAIDATIVVESPADVARLPLDPSTPVAYLTQTTLSLDETAQVVAAIGDRFTDVAGPATDDICYASQNRQNAVKTIAARSDLVLVVGSRNSSNSIRMVEVAAEHGVPARLVPDSTELDPRWLADARVVGVSAGASAPEELVTELLDHLAELGYRNVSLVSTAVETLSFGLPSALVAGSGATPVADETKG